MRTRRNPARGRPVRVCELLRAGFYFSAQLFCADSSPQISAILVGSFTGEKDSLRKSPQELRRTNSKGPGRAQYKPRDEEDHREEREPSPGQLMIIIIIIIVIMIIIAMIIVILVLIFIIIIIIIMITW